MYIKCTVHFIRKLYATRMMKYEDYLNEIDRFLQVKFGKNVRRLDELVLVISDGKEEHSPLSINYEFDEVKVGIGNVLEYYPKEELEKGIWRFLTIPSSKIRRTDYYKGKFHYKSKFEILDERNDNQNFGVSMTWLFPYWKKDKLSVTVQDEFLSIDEVENKFEKIKKAAYNIP